MSIDMLQEFLKQIELRDAIIKEQEKLIIQLYMSIANHDALL